MEPKFVTNEPALLVGGKLVISDLHIGIEHDFRRSGIKVPSQSERMVERIDRLLERTKAGKLIILGDLKHMIPGVSWQEEKEIPWFLNKFAGKLEIVMGNHDPGIERFCSEDVKLHSSKGILIGSYYLSHGHTWPEEEFLKADYLAMGHIQPQVEFTDKLGYRWVEQVWVRAKLEREILKRYKKKGKVPELIIMPAFNTFAGGKTLNSEKQERTERFISPLLRYASMPDARIFLLDGTFLGELGKLKP